MTPKMELLIQILESFLTACISKSYSIIFSYLIGSKMNLVYFILLITSVSGFAAERIKKASLNHQNNYPGGNIGNKKGNHYSTQFDGEYRKNQDHLNTASILSLRLTDASEFQVSVVEAYADYKYNYLDLKLGRFIVPWAPIDEKWGMGYLNNRKNFTFYDPGQEGLIGAKIKLKNKIGFKFETFGSFMYIPELNPSSSVANGEVKSKNIWSQLPPKYADINGTLTPIYYYLEEPNLKDIIMRGSFGQMLGYEKEYFEVNAFYFLKPENSIRPGGDARLTTDGKIIANIKAKLYYEEIYGGNLYLKPKNTNIYFSAFRVDPKNMPANDPLYVQYVKIETKLESRDYVGAGIDYSLDNFVFGGNWIAMVSTPAKSNDLIGNKSRFREAVDFFFTWKITDKLKNTFDIKKDFIKNDTIIMEDLNYAIGKGFNIGGGFNLIDSPNNSSYWAKFRDNDQVYASLGYDF